MWECVGEKKTGLSGLIHQIDPLNSPLDMIFRQTERGSVNKNHGYMTYSLYLSVLTSQGISLKQIFLCLTSIVNGLFQEFEEWSACTILHDWCSLCKKPKVWRGFIKGSRFCCFLFVLVCFMQNWFIQYIFIALWNFL